MDNDQQREREREREAPKIANLNPATCAICPRELGLGEGVLRWLLMRRAQVGPNGFRYTSDAQWLYVKLCPGCNHEISQQVTVQIWNEIFGILSEYEQRKQHGAREEGSFDA